MRCVDSGCACLVLALAAIGCNGDLFVERAADEALLVVIGTDSARQAVLSPAGSDATRIEGVEDGDIVITWSVSTENFVLEDGKSIDVDDLNQVEPVVITPGDVDPMKCPCADPGIESPALVFDGQRCPIPRFVEPVSFQRSGHELVRIDAPSPDFSADVRLDWSGACTGNEAPQLIRVSENCPLTPDATRPVAIAADALGSVLGVNGAALVLVDPDGDRHERSVGLGSIASVVSLNPTGGGSAFVVAARGRDEERLLVVAAWDPGLSPETAFRVDTYPRLLPPANGDVDLIVVDENTVEVLTAEGGGDANAGQIYRCEDLGSAPRCELEDLGVCARPGDPMRAGLALPDGSAVATTILGTVFTRAASSMSWACGDQGSPPIAEIDGVRISARGTATLAWSGRQLVTCFRAIQDDDEQAFVATARFDGVSASGESIPSNISWDVVHEQMGGCGEAVFTPEGRLAIFLQPPGDASSVLVEVDAETGALLGVDRTPGLSANGVLPAIGRPLEAAIAVGSDSYILGEDGAMVKSSSVGFSIAYGSSSHEPAPAGAIAALGDRLFALTRGGALRRFDTADAITTCAELSTTLVSMPGFAPEDLPIAFALSEASVGLVAVDTALGVHALVELDVERETVSSAIDTLQRFVDIAPVTDDTFVLVDEDGALASYHAGQVERLVVDALPEGAKWRSVSAARGLVWASGDNVLAQVIAGPPTDPGRLRVRPQWLDIAGATWTERENIEPPELSSVATWSPWRASIGGRELRPSKGVLRTTSKTFVLDLQPSDRGASLHELFTAGVRGETVTGFGPDGSFALGDSGRRGLLHYGSEDAFVLPYGAPVRARSAGRSTLVGGTNGRLWLMLPE